MWARLEALEPRARLYGLQLDYATAKQNGRCCWFIATLSMLRARGLLLPADFSVQGLRAKSRDWLLSRAAAYRFFGEDYWSFVNACQSAVVTNLVVIAALSVLGDELEVNLEMVVLCTTGSDYFEPVRSQTEWPETVRLVYGFDPENHYVALHQQHVHSLQGGGAAVQRASNGAIQPARAHVTSGPVAGAAQALGARKNPA